MFFPRVLALCALYFSFKVDPFGHQINAAEEKAKVVALEASEVETTIDCIDLNEHEYESIATTTYRSISPTISLRTAATEFGDPDSNGRSKVQWKKN